MNKHFFKVVVISISLLFAMAGQVNAARLGGGKSIGKAPSAPMQKQAAPVQKPTQQAQPAAPTPAPQAAAPSRFGGMGGILGGLAAGLGIGYLLSHLGYRIINCRFGWLCDHVCDQKVVACFIGRWSEQKCSGTRDATHWN